jgi:hypothetical protein
MYSKTDVGVADSLHPKKCRTSSVVFRIEKDDLMKRNISVKHAERVSIEKKLENELLIFCYFIGFVKIDQLSFEYKS